MKNLRELKLHSFIIVLLNLDVYIKSIEINHLMIGTSVIFIESCFMVSAIATEIPS